MRPVLLPIIALALSVPFASLRAAEQEQVIITQADAGSVDCATAKTDRDRDALDCPVAPLLGDPLDRSEPDAD
jgi:hypothetical protein